MTQHFPHASARAQRHRHHITTGGIGDGDLREARTRSDASKALLTVLLLALTLTEVPQTTAFTPLRRRDVIANTQVQATASPRAFSRFRHARETGTG
jgi:hypothetical protein